ncbi:class I SAM-dependent methyltransferase [Coraliomargarita sp. SDUM461003]|uniref:Class I SAM-dependent methyltransferase n=1 Tax=Thalassobacterium maritimum TaxID=3041265 RepID=A0ABU1AU77_9BACT|nr:class I SAM-dependent methyltransferase [Coraliomargarita sp. SDUM461003]MDQ8206799.1 class I SAM-dependent methyltransferase [Coraliomargarita sp. SDUM461003]
MNYSRLAPFYQCIERCTMGSALQRARTGQLDRLAAMTQPQRVLIVGEGDGSFLLQFARLFPTAHITVVEPSAGMVARAQARLRRAGLASERIAFRQEPLLEAELPEAAYDLIVTLFFLDNFEDALMRASVAKLNACACDSAYWLLSDFCLPSRGWRRLRARFWLRVLYGFFGLSAGLSARVLPDFERAVQATEFCEVHRHGLCGSLLFSALYRMPARVMTV